MSMTVENDLKFGGLVDATAKGAGAGLEDAAYRLLEVSRSKAPLLTGEEPLRRANKERRADPGALRDSAYARSVDDTTAEVGFTEFYAGWQHERMDYRHVDGQAKFLEQPMVEMKDELLQVVADRIREELSR